MSNTDPVLYVDKWAGLIGETASSLLSKLNSQLESPITLEDVDEWLAMWGEDDELENLDYDELLSYIQSYHFPIQYDVEPPSGLANAFYLTLVGIAALLAMGVSVLLFAI